MNDWWFWDIITTYSRGFLFCLWMCQFPLNNWLLVPRCEIAVCPVMAASAFQQSPQAQSADSECFYNRTYSLLISKQSPDAFFVWVSPSLINVIGESWKCCQAQRCHPTLLNKWTELIVCLWFEILITLKIWGHHMKSPLGTNMLWLV